MFYIELVEPCACSTKEELSAKAGEWIRSIATLTAYIAGITQEDYRNDHKEEARERATHWINNNN